MEEWRAKAAECFPEFREIVDEARDPICLWIDLFMCLCNAYDLTPPNDDMIRRIYDFADWCFRQPETDSVETDLSSAVVVSLIESIPLDQRVAADLHRWFSIEDIKGFESLLRYHQIKEEYDKFLLDFIRKKAAQGNSRR